MAHTPPPDETPDPLSSVDTPLTCALGLARPDCDDLEVLHRRPGHTSHNILREAVRNGLVTRVQLNRMHFGTRAKIKRVLCDTCAKAKISRTSFPRWRERMADFVPGLRVSADILIMLKPPLVRNLNMCGYIHWSRGKAFVLKCLDALVQSDFSPFGFTLRQRRGARVSQCTVVPTCPPDCHYTHLGTLQK